MARKHASAHHEENAERWLLTYADMITLLMAFFIMMFAMSQVDKSKFAAMVQSVQRQLGAGASTAAAATSPPGKVDIAPSGGGAGIASGFGAIADGFGAIAAEMLQREMKDTPTAKLVSTEETPQAVIVHVQTTNLLFAPGRADVSPEMGALLDHLAQALVKMPNDLRIEGHTCNYPTHNAVFSDNWELSAARATNVALHLIRADGIPPARLGTVGYADTKPLLPNTCEENRRANRRIDLVLLKSAPTREERAAKTESIAPGLAAEARGPELGVMR